MVLHPVGAIKAITVKSLTFSRCKFWFETQTCTVLFQITDLENLELTGIHLSISATINIAKNF